MASLESCRSSFSSLSLATTGASSGGGGGMGANDSQKSLDCTPISLKKTRANMEQRKSSQSDN